MIDPLLIIDTAARVDVVWRAGVTLVRKVKGHLRKRTTSGDSVSSTNGQSAQAMAAAADKRKILQRNDYLKLLACLAATPPEQHPVCRPHDIGLDMANDKFRSVVGKLSKWDYIRADINGGSIVVHGLTNYGAALLKTTAGDVMAQVGVNAEISLAGIEFTPGPHRVLPGSAVIVGHAVDKGSSQWGGLQLPPARSTFGDAVVAFTRDGDVVVSVDGGISRECIVTTTANSMTIEQSPVAFHVPSGKTT